MHRRILVTLFLEPVPGVVLAAVVIVGIELEV
jgi:hypothetical protein